MRRFLPLLVILFVGCSGGPGSGSTGASTAASNPPSGPAGSAVSPAPAGSGAASPVASPEASAGSNAGPLPPDCAKGLADYLVAIEPLVSKFDPAKATLGDLFTAKDAVQTKSVELLMANDATAPYSTGSEVGLERAYFDSRSPWDASSCGRRRRGTRHRGLPDRPAGDVRHGREPGQRLRGRRVRRGGREHQERREGPFEQRQS